MRALALWDDILTEAQYLRDLPGLVWDTLADVIAEPGFTGPHLRSYTLEMVQVSMAYLDRNAYASLREYPLALSQGSLENNLTQLLSVDIGSLDPLTKQIHMCAKLMPQQTRQAIRLLQDAPCSIGLVEKGHAAGAFAKRFHGTLGQRQLEMRAYVNEARPLFRMSAADKGEDKLRRRFESLLKASKKIRYTGANHFCSQAIRQAKVSVGAGGSDIGNGLQKRCIAKHNERYNELSVMEKRALEAEAARVREQRAAEKLDDAGYIAGQLLMLDRRTHADRDGGAS